MIIIFLLTADKKGNHLNESIPFQGTVNSTTGAGSMTAC